MTHAELTAAGFAVTPAAHRRLVRFVDALLRENARVNLTAIRDPADVWRRHVCDSLALLPLLHETTPSHLLDLGTGGGIPGVPLACVAPRTQFALVDATRKKVAAVERIVAHLALSNVHAVWGRAEELAHRVEFRERFDAVCARAVAPLPTLIEYAAGFVRPGGFCWFAKTVAAATREVDLARRAAGQCRLRYVETRRFELPGDGGERAIVVYRKTARLPDDLPRGEGKPKKKPL
jgi:16S rRNA (guanine527-N7)-methyltransferase